MLKRRCVLKGGCGGWNEPQSMMANDRNPADPLDHLPPGDPVRRLFSDAAVYAGAVVLEVATGLPHPLLDPAPEVTEGEPRNEQ